MALLRDSHDDRSELWMVQIGQGKLHGDRRGDNQPQQQQLHGDETEMQ